MGTRRYHQFCGVAKALDVVGERWTLLLVRDLLLGGRRFSDLLAAMPGLTPNLLAQRLRDMQAHDLVDQRRLPPPQGSTVYELTALGRELEPVVLALGRFGARWLDSPAAGDRIDPRWAMVSLKRRYRGCPRPWRVGLFPGPLAFSLELGGERLEVHDGAPERPDLSLRGDLSGFGPLLRGMASARALVDQGRLECEGPRRALVDFARAFEGMQP
ncbi:MAG: transcriptional regulator [Myxococcales bacterium]|nr:transcriptional regulator [Myxococcales bacterium]